jgi:hypothetical protein
MRGAGWPPRKSGAEGGARSREPFLTCSTFLARSPPPHIPPRLPSTWASRPRFPAKIRAGGACAPPALPPPPNAGVASSLPLCDAHLFRRRMLPSPVWATPPHILPAVSSPAFSTRPHGLPSPPVHTLEAPGFCAALNFFSKPRPSHHSSGRPCRMGQSSPHLQHAFAVSTIQGETRATARPREGHSAWRALRVPVTYPKVHRRKYLA